MQAWRVFLDANILFSASLRRGPVATLVDALQLRHHVLTSDLALTEARRNLLHKQPQALSALDAILARLQLITEPAAAHHLNLPAADSQVLSSAIAASCTHFLTGDKTHFGRYYGQHIGGVLIISPSALALERNLL